MTSIIRPRRRGVPSAPDAPLVSSPSCLPSAHPRPRSSASFARTLLVLSQTYSMMGIRLQRPAVQQGLRGSRRRPPPWLPAGAPSPRTSLSPHGNHPARPRSRRPIPLPPARVNAATSSVGSSSVSQSRAVIAARGRNFHIPHENATSISPAGTMRRPAAQALPQVLAIIDQNFESADGGWHHGRVIIERDRRERVDQGATDEAQRATKNRWGRGSRSVPLRSGLHHSLGRRRRPTATRKPSSTAYGRWSSRARWRSRAAAT